MINKNSFSYKDLIACAKGKLFGEGNAKDNKKWWNI